LLFLRGAQRSRLKIVQQKPVQEVTVRVCKRGCAVHANSSDNATGEHEAGLEDRPEPREAIQANRIWPASMQRAKLQGTVKRMALGEEAYACR
jgi:hypothetical protein